MQDVQKGQTIHNSRTGDNGKVTGFTAIWNGRHNVKKVVVDVLGEKRVWAFSSCKVVEDLAPRSLVKLREIIQWVKQKNNSELLDSVCVLYGETSLIVGAFTDSKCHDLGAYTRSASKFNSLSPENLASCLVLVEFAATTALISEHEKRVLGIANHLETGNLTSELISVYLGRK